MKILAVSDSVSQSLENMVARLSAKLQKIDLIVSCGDLPSSYIEYLVDALNKDFVFVCGNHILGEDTQKYDDGSVIDKLWERFDTDKIKHKMCVAGSSGLHGDVEEIGDYLFVGFAGSKWYGGHGIEYTEREMAKAVSKATRTIRWHRFKERLLNKKKKEVVVISHAPIHKIHDEPDVCHSGFKCFRAFVKNVSPVLWIHGHVHLSDMHKSQVTLLNRTIVMNAFGYKFINVDKKSIKISYKHDIL